MELLNSLDRYPSADVFSLGLTLYETCFPLPPPLSPLCLPAEGELWHLLRSGSAEPVKGRPLSLQTLVSSCMCATASDRTTTSQMLSLKEVVHSLRGNDDPTIANARSVTPLRGGLNRAESFLPIFTEGWTGDGDDRAATPLF